MAREKELFKNEDDVRLELFETSKEAYQEAERLMSARSPAKIALGITMMFLATFIAAVGIAMIVASSGLVLPYVAPVLSSTIPLAEAQLAAGIMAVAAGLLLFGGGVVMTAEGATSLEKPEVLPVV